MTKQVEALKTRHVQLKVAFRRMGDDPEYGVIVEWVERNFDSKLMPTNDLGLERLVGQRDVFRDMRKMIRGET